MSDKDILREAIAAFERCDSNETDNRKLATEDIEFARLSKQWPDKVKKQRDLEGRPCLTINKLGPVIRQVVNDARQNRPSIKVIPSDSKADPETAELMSGLIRNIEHTSNADVAYDTAIDNSVSGGFGYWRVNLDYAYGGTPDDIEGAGIELFEQDIKIERVANPFSVYGDPDSTAADSSDWNCAFVVDRVPVKDFKRKYPNAKRADFENSAWDVATGLWRTDEDVMIAEYWKREEATKLVVGVQLPDTDDGPGDVIVVDAKELAKNPDMGAAVTQMRPIKRHKVTRYLLTAVEVLETTPWPGSYIPIVPVYGDEVNIKGTRHFRSLIRDAKDANQMFNYWRTTATEMVALAPRVPYIGPKGSFETDAAKWATANSASHAYIEYDDKGQPPQRQPFPSLPAGAIQEAMNASEDIKAITGIYDASLGAKSNETSGRAIMARQREGDISTFHFVDNLTRAIRHTGRIIIDLIPKVYSTPRIIRILGEDGTPERKPVNGAQVGDSEEADENINRIHDLRVGKYDLVVTAGPSFTSRREEAATQMIELIRSYPDAAPIIGDLLAKNLDWPGADEIAERLKKMLPPQARDEEGGIPPEVQQQIEQMGQALQEMGQRLQEAEGKNDLEAKKLSIEAYKAETERMTALSPAMGPEEIQALVLQTLQQLTSPNDLPEAEGADGPTATTAEPESMPAY